MIFEYKADRIPEFLTAVRLAREAFGSVALPVDRQEALDKLDGCILACSQSNSLGSPITELRNAITSLFELKNKDESLDDPFVVLAYALWAAEFALLYGPEEDQLANFLDHWLTIYRGGE